jgi:uncharacterized protein YjbJ (UPF0337 family)
VRLIPRVNYQNLGGLADKIVGLTREVVGVAFDDDRLIRAGEAQQNKGSERLKQLRAEAEARAHHEKARRQDEKQREVQDGQRRSRETSSSRS